MTAQISRNLQPLASRIAARSCAVVALSSLVLLGGCYQTTGRAATRTNPAVPQRTPEDIALENVAKGKTLQNKGQNVQALLAFERAIESNPTLTQAYVGAAQIYQAQGDYATAADRYGQAAELEPRNFDAQYGYGLMLQLLDRVSESIRAYLKALSLKPNDFNTNLNLATAYFQIGEANEALPYARRAVQLNAKSAEARVNLGAIHGALDQNEEAVNEYVQALELGPLQPPVLLNLAESYNKLKRYDEMVNTLSQLVRTNASPVAYERLGSGLFRLKKYDDAEAAFRKAIELDGNHFPALNGVGVCMLNKFVWGGSVDEAMKKEAVGFLRRS
ncbi:MAG: tetratricopeptide repeat protein, partial [Planctomycetota bacterium]|nr:tetratricopeptide repeat protein [Planctomycetota bacterium]